MNSGHQGMTDKVDTAHSPTLHSSQVKEEQSGPPATGLRKPKSPKSAGESAGNSAGKKGAAGGTAGSSAVSLFFQRKRPPSTAPSSPPGSPLFPRTVPGISLALLWDSGFLSSVAGGPDCKSRRSKGLHAVAVAPRTHSCNVRPRQNYC